MSFLISIAQNLLPFLGVLTVLVFVHELGHYWVARLNNVHVEVFSVGFGPELIGRTDKNKTRWRLSLVPLGGYVRMLGDLDAASRPDEENLKQMSIEEKQHALHYKHPKQRIAVSAAGPISNFILAFVILSGVFMTAGQPVYLPVVGLIQPNTAAEKVGLQAGDIVRSINGTVLQRFDEIPLLVNQHGAAPLEVVIERQGIEMPLKIQADSVQNKNNFSSSSTTYRLGIGRHTVEYIKRGPIEACVYAAQEIWHVIKSTGIALGRVITGNASGDELGGPLRIAQLSSHAAQLGGIALLLLTAMLSINLGLINLLPVPMLDGGHIVMLLAEWVRGRPLGEKVQEYAYWFGLLLVGGLMIFSLWNDLIHLKAVDFVINLFK